MDEKTIDRLKKLEKDLLKLRQVKRCPKCGSLSLEYDEVTHKVKCSDCGYEASLPK